jgi:copper oxidase (laccase) domain-containing protein
MAVMGPTISQSSYEVGKEYYERFSEESEANSKFFIPSDRAGYYQFDLPAYVQSQLKIAGIKSVGNVQMDTYSNEEIFFSYRRSCHKNEPDYGRNLSVIAIRD